MRDLRLNEYPVFLSTPLLNAEERSTIEQVISEVVTVQAIPKIRMRPYVAFLYQRKGNRRSRDFRPVPGVSYETHLGPLTSVQINDEGEIRLLVQSMMRGDGFKPWRWLTTIPDRVSNLVLTGYGNMFDEGRDRRSSRNYREVIDAA